MALDLTDFLSGTCAGFAITVVGHPFDTVKVRLQTQHLLVGSLEKPFKGGLDCMWRTLANEGVRGLYKGMSGPLATTPGINAIVFGAYEQGLRFLHKDPDTNPSLNVRVAAGAWSGLVNTAIVAPMELIKTRLQLEYANVTATGQKPGPWMIIKKIYRHNGIRGLGVGTNITIAREVPAYMAQFYAYAYCKSLWCRILDCEEEYLPAYALMSSGSIGGMSAWIASYPQDVIKSQLQMQKEGEILFPKHRWIPDGGTISCARTIWNDKGWRGFSVGFGPCMGRAVPANAVGFLTYEWTSKFLKDLDMEALTV